MGFVLMSKRELNRLDVLARLDGGGLTPSAAADLMRLTLRQTYRLLKRYRNGGAPAVADQRRGQPSNNRLPDVVRDHAVALVREHYADFGPTLAAEKLAERHELRVSRETLRGWMRQAGIWLPRAERKRFQQPRHRREHLGELIQIDGSEHRWFEDRAPPCTLLVFIDDATSTLMELRFVASESTFAYFETLKGYLRQHGKPVAFYSDKHSIFRVSNEDAAGGDGMTQFGRALSELNIEILCANSSQAKGRVERAHQTLQDRLVKELRLAGISSIEAANAFLPAFMADYNRRFAKAPASEHDLHRPMAGTDRLDDILCWREQRYVSRQLVVNYNRMKLMLRPDATTACLAGKLIEVYDFPDGRLELRWKGLALPYSAFDKLQRVSHAAIVENKRLGEVLAWIKEQQDREPNHRGDLVGPRRSSQKAGLLKDRADRLAQVAKSQKPARLARRRCDMEVSAATGQAPSEAAE
ncbi:ISNCY family transposase [Bradyrhizobium sp. CB1650]|uniref:ISNCY family transposase n=1 Tax=Bradyrhizobium sp. CB1650 TaxID=3039153 RepID=UPI0024353180|nr:ISNCY family transposase [Bradyrhizobium sp. CB1650]WGD48618.1 ISNCY family transposase [Bradyrhizobium sp. CB1650]WGD55067.1 ISNCY family transposase [Bradyrhizobium sp. CB1650]